MWLYPNIAGTRDVREDVRPTWLVLPEGIPVFPVPPGDESPSPRLPLLGLRALTDYRLDVTIRGRKRLVSARSAGR